MDIKSFITILLVLGIAAYFIPVENIKKDKSDKDIPLVIFEEPLMYTFNDSTITRVVQASHAVRYKNRDEMFNADIILNNIDKTKKYITEKFKADIIIKKKELYTLFDNVKYTRDNFITFSTNELYYNENTKIVYNDKPFEAKYYKSLLKGTNLYFDTTEKEMKSQNTHFEIDMKKGK